MPYVRQCHSLGRLQRYSSLPLLPQHPSSTLPTFPAKDTQCADRTEYVYGTTIQHNYNVGWGVMTLSSYDVIQQSRQLPGYQTSMLGQILANETDPLFSWQYNEVGDCDLKTRA